MDQLYHGQLYLFILTTTTLFTGIQSMGVSSYNWFHAQKQCSGHGLTIEENQSGQPYWTGVYRRLTPWINIIGCYSNSIESLHDVVKKTLAISSVGLCQEMCFHENSYKFALKMNICLCIGRDILFNPNNGLSPSNCTYRCEDYPGDTYLRDCGGESAYNIYEIQGVEYMSLKTYLCLSLQCSKLDTRFIPQKCSQYFGKICGNLVFPHNSFPSNWTLSMEQCRKSQPSTYLSGNFDLEHPDPVCSHLQNQIQVVWLGVARQIYTGIDQGWEIKEEQRETFVECQMCTDNGCSFRRCTDLSASYIYCKSISDTSTSMLNHSTSKELLFGSSSTTAKFDEDQFAPTNDTLQMSGDNGELVLQITLPLILGVITLLLCAMGVVLYKRRSKMAKTDGTPKVEIDSPPKKHVYSELDFDHSNPSFALEHCYQQISNLSNSSNESPYNNSEEDVDDHLRDKQSRKTEVDIVYQNASTDIY